MCPFGDDVIKTNGDSNTRNGLRITAINYVHRFSESSFFSLYHVCMQIVLPGAIK